MVGVVATIAFYGFNVEVIPTILWKAVSCTLTRFKKLRHKGAANLVRKFAE